MKIGIVGGTGNISTSVVRLLLEHGHEVNCINRGRSGDVQEGARHLSGDRDDLEWFIPAVQRENFDAAIDFISFFPAQAKASFEAFRGVGHFVHTSTVVTFGEEFDWLPVTEDHPARPTIEYGRNKAAIDSYYRAAFFADGFPVTIIKPSTTYGPRRVVRQAGIDTRWIEYLESNGLVEDVPLGDWEDDIIAAQLGARQQILSHRENDRAKASS